MPSHNGHCEVALRNGVGTLGKERGRERGREREREREREEDIIEVEVEEGIWKVE